MQKTFPAALTLVCATLAHAQTVSTPADGRVLQQVPAVFDAQGKRMGDLAHFASGDGLLVTSGNQRYVLPLQRKTSSDIPSDYTATSSGSLMIWKTSHLLYYTSADCSGDPIVASSGGPYPAIAVRNGSAVTVIFASGAPYGTINANSNRQDTGACNVLATPVAQYGWKAGAKVVVTQGHPEPLAIGF
jgi:hypothetical protein